MTVFFFSYQSDLSTDELHEELTVCLSFVDELVIFSPAELDNHYFLNLIQFCKSVSYDELLNYQTLYINSISESKRLSEEIRKQKELVSGLESQLADARNIYHKINESFDHIVAGMYAVARDFGY